MREWLLWNLPDWFILRVWHPVFEWHEARKRGKP